MNVVVLNDRQAKLLEVILQSKNVITLQSAAEKSRIQASPKTIRADFSKIQDFAVNFNVTFALVRGKVTTQATDMDIQRLLQASISLRQNSNIAYTTDRVYLIILDCLLLRPIPSLDQWSNRFNVSRPCIQRDIKKVRQWLLEQSLNLTAVPAKGYSLTGTEYQIRKALVRWTIDLFGSDVLSNFNQRYADFYHDALWMRLTGDVNVTQISQLISEFASNNQIDIKKHQFTMLVLYLAFSIHRIQNGCSISDTEFSQQPSIICSEAILLLASALNQHIGLHLSSGELSMLQLNYQELLYSPPQENAKNTQIAEAGQLLVQEFICDAELMLGLPFEDDKHFASDFSEFISSMLRNAKYLANSFSDLDIASFAEAYPVELALGQRMLRVVHQALDIELPASCAVEVGVFIASRVEKMISNKRKKNILLVSSDNIELHLLHYWQLVNRLGYFLNRIEIISYHEVLVRNIDLDVDFVISTVDISSVGAKNIVIPKILTEHDISLLRKKLLGNVHTLQTSVTTNSLNTLAYYDSQSKNAQELFDRIGSLLEENGHVFPGYTGKLREHERVFGSGIETPIPLAVPHTEATYTKAPVLAIVVTKNPISMHLIGSDQSIFTNIVLFPVLDSDNIEMGLAFYSVISKLRNKKLATALQNCATSEEISSFIKENL